MFGRGSPDSDDEDDDEKWQPCPEAIFGGSGRKTAPTMTRGLEAVNTEEGGGSPT
jgi:hypothetical protein